MKRLQRYYYLVGIPVLLLALGATLFFEPIANTVRGNPHPQINYVIFLLMAVGAALMLMHVRRINREGQLVQDFLDRLKQQGHSPEATAQWLQQAAAKASHDVADLLQEVLTRHDRVLGAVEHAAIEAELDRFQAQQHRRLLVAQYLPGLMVGMGLFGTFIGLLGALQEIGKLIGGFAVGSGMTDPVAAVAELVTRLTEPMKAMGVAFSASLFGVLGSMVMGMLMVFVKGGTAELLALVRARVGWMLELSQATGEQGANLEGVQPLQDALAELAEHSPLLQGLALALDNSERRVRDLMFMTSELVAKVDLQVKTAMLMTPLFESMLASQNATANSSAQIAQALETQTHAIKAISEQVTKQTDLLANTYTSQQRIMGEFDIRKQEDAARYAEMLQTYATIWKNGMDKMQDGARQQTELMVDALNRFDQSSESKNLQLQQDFRRQHEQIQALFERQVEVFHGFLDVARHQGEASARLREQHNQALQQGLAQIHNGFVEEFSAERRSWGLQMESSSKAVLLNQELFGKTLRDFEMQQSRLVANWESLLESQFKGNGELTVALQETRNTLNAIQETLRQDGTNRTELLMIMKSTLEETKFRMQQVVASGRGSAAAFANL